MVTLCSCMKEKEEEKSMRSPKGRQGKKSDASSDVDEVDYELEGVKDRIESSRGSRFNLLQNQLRLDSTTRRKFSHERLINGIRDFSNTLVIHPENRFFEAWMKFILIWAVYSSFFTPLEFGFFRGLPERLQFLDIAGQFAFFVDIILQFFVAYRDNQTYRMVYDRAPIALRYMKSTFVLDLLSCMPWDDIYKASGKREGVRFLMWIRLIRLCKVSDFFHNLEKDIRVKYMFTRIVKLIVVELYCTHTAACIFYYLATTLPPSQEGYTWIGSLKMGDYSYSHFREIDIWTRYTTSMYFAIVTMTTVGYGDIHAVNRREMIFIMIYVSFDMVLGAYLVGNMTAIIVKGSNTERFRDKMTDIMKYMNRNRLGKDIRNQVKGHLRLQYEHSYTEAPVLQEIPIAIRAKISQTLYLSYIENVALFEGCSSEFINQIVIRLHEEFFLPGEVIMEPGTVVDQLYFVCHGVLEEVGVKEDGSEETISLLQPNSSIGEVSIVCNIPHPYTVRVCELCRLVRLDKQSFNNILEIYFCDGRKILNNLLKGKKSNIRVKQLESDVTFHIGRQEAELSLKVNSAAYYGDLHQLKGLIRAGADSKKADYDGRSPLHIAAARGFEDVTSFLIHEGVEINLKDNFGNTPLLEALKNGHDGVAALLVNEGASFDIENAGTFLCTAVVRGETDILRRVLSHGMDPNSKDYDNRTPLHVAASQGLYLMAKLLVEAGASVLLRDRWGNTPLDEGRMCGNKNLVKLLEVAKDVQLSEYPSSREITDNLSRTPSKFSFEDQISKKRETLPSSSRKCTVFPFHPWDPKEQRTSGIVLWVPLTIEELVATASEYLQISVAASCILTEDAGKILDASLIENGQKLYLVSQTQ